MDQGAHTGAGTGPSGAPGAGLDDQTLVARAAEGDARAFEALVRRHQRPLFALAVRLVGNRDDAEDSVQESFVAAWRRLPEFRGEAAFSSWMYRIVTNRCLSLARRRRETVPLDTERHGLATSQADEPALATEAEQRLAALGEALAELPGEQRACWVLRHLHGLGYTEIGEIVGAEPAAVRGRIHRARTRLAEVMRPWR
jgi:RNA polymerase sigma-70 factor (ECF subfamily)